MNEPLRPMDLGAILDRTLQIYRGRFLVCVGLASIPVVAMDLIYSADEFWLHAKSRLHPVGPIAAYLWAFAISATFYQLARIFGILIQPAFVTVTSASTLGGAWSLRSSIQFAAMRWKSSLWVAVLKVAADVILPGLVIAGVGAALVVSPAHPAASGLQLLPPLINVLATAVGSVLLLWIGACLSLAIPAMASEDVTGLASLRRSLTLSKGSRFRIAFTIFSTFLALWVLSVGLEFLLGQLMSLIGSVLHIAHIMRRLYSPAVFIVVTAIYIVLGPFLPIAITLFYYDQRIRREGYDVERMMVAAGLDPNAVDIAAGLPAPAVPALAHGVLPALAESREGNQQA
jgi:hypothetical protein